MTTATTSNPTGYTLETDAEFLTRSDRGMTALRARLEREYPVGSDGQPAWDSRRTLADVQRLSSPEATQQGDERASEGEETTGPAFEVTFDQFDITRHDAKLTLVSSRSGEHRTFRIRTANSGSLKGARLVELLTGPDNRSDYKAFAFIVDETFGPKHLTLGSIYVWKDFQGDGTRKGRSIYERFADLLSRPSHWASKGVSYMISLKCRRCGRDLTRPDSIRDGLGETCRKKGGLA